MLMSPLILDSRLLINVEGQMGAAYDSGPSDTFWSKTIGLTGILD